MNMGRIIYMRRIIASFFAAIFVLITLTSVNTSSAQTVLIPNFWDPNTRYTKPNFSILPRLRFLTTTDFPPFNFIDRKKRLSGFHVDLARAICDELNILEKCQIQAVRWEDLEKMLEKGEGEAIIAGLDINAATRQKYAFSHPYLSIPGRFITKRNKPLTAPIYNSLFKKTVGVVQGSAHQKYFSGAFGERKFVQFPTRQAVFNALKAGNVDAVFTDAISGSFWLASQDAADCCIYSGGPYLSKEFFGNGLAIAVSKKDQHLANGFNYALKQISEKGVFKELYLKYFPLGLY